MCHQFIPVVHLKRKYSKCKSFHRQKCSPEHLHSDCGTVSQLSTSLSSKQLFGLWLKQQSTWHIFHHSLLSTFPCSWSSWVGYGTELLISNTSSICSSSSYITVSRTTILYPHFSNHPPYLLSTLPTTSLIRCNHQQLVH